MPTKDRMEATGEKGVGGGGGDNSGGGGKEGVGTIFHAARTGDAAFIQSIILDGADVNERDAGGER